MPTNNFDEHETLVGANRVCCDKREFSGQLCSHIIDAKANCIAPSIFVDNYLQVFVLLQVILAVVNRELRFGTSRQLDGSDNHTTNACGYHLSTRIELGSDRLLNDF